MKRLVILALLPLGIWAQHLPGVYSEGPRGEILPRRSEVPLGFASGAASPAALNLGTISAAEKIPIRRPGAWQIGVQRAVAPDRLTYVPVASSAHPGAARLTAILSPGAVSMRVHFVNFTAGRGKVWLYDRNRAHVIGPYTAHGPF